MQSTHLKNLLGAAGASSVDALHWLDGLDLEPEICHCLSHGQELPCGQCDQLVFTTNGKASR